MHNRAGGPKPQKIYKKKELPAPPTSSTPRTSVRLECGEDWLVLLTSALDEVHAISTSEGNSQQRTVFLVLDAIGIFSFLSDVWSWQDINVCQAFVLHWDHRMKTTEILGIYIDASYRNFLLVTGLDSKCIVETGSSSNGMERDDNKCKKKRGVDYVVDMESKPISFVLLNNPIIESLLFLLSRTLWLTDKQSHCPSKDMVYFLVESMRGKRVDWSKSVYERFISEIRELQDRHENDPNEKLQTLAGPLMCFLYSQAKHKADAMKENTWALEKWDGKQFESSYKDHCIGLRKEKNRYDYDNGDVVPPGFCPENLKLPVPPSGMPSNRWYEINDQSRTVNMNLVPQAELPNKTQEEIHFELEERFSKNIASNGYEVSEEMMAELTAAFQEQKERQERFKNHLRSSWQRLPVSCNLGCCLQGMRISQKNFQR